MEKKKKEVGNLNKFIIKLDPTLQETIKKASRNILKASQNFDKSVKQNSKSTASIQKSGNQIVKASQSIQKSGSGITKASQNMQKSSSHITKASQNMQKSGSQMAKVSQNMQKSYSGAVKNSQNINIVVNNIPQGTGPQSAKDDEKSESLASKTGNLIKGAFKNTMSFITSKVGPVLMDAGKKGILLASELKQVQKTVDLTFGDNSNKINQWSQKAANSFGITELQAKQFTGTLGMMFKSNGIPTDKIVTMSEKLTALSGDFASFKGISQEEAFEKIKAAVAGSGEELQALGVNMSNDKLQAYTLANGIKTSYEEMDAASQMALRYKYLISETKQVQGDFVKNQGSYANQAILLRANIDKLSASIGSVFLPALSKCMQMANGLFDKLFEDPSNIKNMQDAIAKVLDTLMLGIPIIGKVLSAITNSALLPVILDTVDQMIPVISEIFDILSNALYGVIPVLASVIKNLLPLIVPILNIIIAALKPFLPVIVRIIGFIGSIISQFSSALLPLLNSIIPIIHFLATAIGESLGNSLDFILPIIQFLSDRLSFAMRIMSELINFVVNVFKGNWSGAWQSIQDIFSLCWENTISSLKGYLNIVIGYLNNIIGNINQVSGAIGDVIGVNLRIPKIPTFASGGIANKPSIFGEAGPEMAIPLKKSPRSLGLLAQTAQILGVAMPNSASTGASSAIQGSGAPNVTINLTINADNGSANDIAVAAEGAIYQAIDRYFRDRERVAYGY